MPPMGQSPFHTRSAHELRNKKAALTLHKKRKTAQLAGFRNLRG
jgi:hypothetical protein